MKVVKYRKRTAVGVLGLEGMKVFTTHRQASDEKSLPILLATVPHTGFKSSGIRHKRSLRSVSRFQGPGMVVVMMMQ